MQVVGIGTVELPVKRSPTATGPRSHGIILRLRNVLHVPTLMCNIVGNPILDEYNVLIDIDKDKKGFIQDKHGRAVTYFDPSVRLCQVKLSDPPVGPRVGPDPFDPSKLYMINILWADSERKKWEASCASGSLQKAELGHISIQERQWLKQHWGDEFKFLASHGLNINKEDDREEGRSILRAMMVSGDGDKRRRRRRQRRQRQKRNQSGVP